LKAACRQHATAHFYSVTIKRSDYKMGVLLLHCGKSGTREGREGGRSKSAGWEDQPPLFIYLVTGWADNRRERPFSLLLFFCLCSVVTQWRGRPHVPQTHWKPLFDIMVFSFQNFWIILKFWPLEAIYMCRLLQLKKIKN
jgi:hypothetical protein